MHTTMTFPSDIEACHRLLREQRISLVEKDNVITECQTVIAAKDALVAQQNQQLVEQKDKLVEMQLRLNAALQAAFRKKIERYTADPSQLKIDFGNSPEVADAAEGIADAALESVEGYNRRKQKPAKARNEQLPPHLPRIEVLLPVPEDNPSLPYRSREKDREERGLPPSDSLQSLARRLVRSMALPQPCAQAFPGRWAAGEAGAAFSDGSSAAPGTAFLPPGVAFFCRQLGVFPSSAAWSLRRDLVAATAQRL